MNEDFGGDIITIADEEGNEFELEILDELEKHGVDCKVERMLVLQFAKTGQSIDPSNDTNNIDNIDNTDNLGSVVRIEVPAMPEKGPAVSQGSDGRDTGVQLPSSFKDMIVFQDFPGSAEGTDDLQGIKVEENLWDGAAAADTRDVGDVGDTGITTNVEDTGDTGDTVHMRTSPDAAPLEKKILDFCERYLDKDYGSICARALKEAQGMYRVTESMDEQVKDLLAASIIYAVAENSNATGYRVNLLAGIPEHHVGGDEISGFFDVDETEMIRRSAMIKHDLGIRVSNEWLPSYSQLDPFRQMAAEYADSHWAP